MRCDEARRTLSAAFDGEPIAEEDARRSDDHRQTCPACEGFAADLTAVRHHLRFEVVDEVPDLVPSVLRRLPTGRPPTTRRWLPAAAAFVAGAVAGATLLAGSRTGDGGVAAADIPERVVIAQQAVGSLAATVEVVERGWHPDVPVRRFVGTLTYRAPETLSLTLSDETTYPTPAWVPDDVALAVDGGTLWRKGPRACPAENQPACTPPTPEVTVVERREPFADASPVPLELVTPVESFALAGTPATVAGRRVDGRDTIGLAVSASQVSVLLEGLRPAGNLREVHPLDRVELWLDRRTYVPLALRVVAADRPERARWAAARRYQDRPGDVVLEVELRDVRVNEAGTGASSPPHPPVDAHRVDAGFVDGPSDAPRPATLPAGLTPSRQGTLTGTGPEVSVRTWTDGRAWLKVRATTGWTGGRLFGDLGPIVRVVDLGSSGIGYASEDGSRVALHGDGIDVVVVGSLPSAQLRVVAAELGVHGLPVPPWWDEAATATLAEARATIDGLLVPSGLSGFGPPAVRVEAGAVSMAYAGPGDRGFLLVQLPEATFTPPLDPDAQGVLVRGREGRYSPARGELEWGEKDRVISLRSTTLSLPELLAVAERLEAT